MEAEIPDALAKAIIEALIRPEVNSGNLYQGIKNFYSFFSDQEIQEMIEEDHGAEVTCQFCNTTYQFTEEELKEILYAKHMENR